MNPDENQTNNNGAQSNSDHKDPVMDFTKGNNSTVMAILAYIGPLVLVPFLMNKENEFVKFHTKQGLVLFGLEIIIMIISRMSIVWILSPVLNLATLILSIIGVVYVAQGQKKALPVIGSLANNIKV